MRIIALGDIHGHKSWKDIVNNEQFDKIVFVGDYFDSFTVKTEDQVNNFLDIIEFKKSRPDDVILLIGNHDHHYFPFVGYTGTSGYQQAGKFLIEPVLDKNKDYLQMAYQFDNVLFTHAGFSPLWAGAVLGDDWEKELTGNYADLINDIWLHKPKAFCHNGRDPYGDDKYQTPIWIRPRALMYIARPISRKIIQIVGHTYQNQIDIKGKSTGGRYYFIDCLPKEYLIIDNGKFEAGKLEKYAG